MDKRLSFGRIVGKMVRMVDTGEIGLCVYYSKIEKEFQVELDSFKNKHNPAGICFCIRDDFEVI